MVILTEKFQFIKDDVFLCPQVNTETGKQKLIMQKINLKTNEIEFEDSIDCIHPAITDISVDQFNNNQKNGERKKNLLKKTLFIRSTENLREINLAPEEKFKALKSWTAGIAELGIDALTVQTEIGNSADLEYPMIHKLLQFLTKVEADFIYQYLSKIEKECKFEGINHNSSIIANLLPILMRVVDINGIKFGRKELNQENRRIIFAILSIDPPYELFEQNPALIPLLFDFNIHSKNYTRKIRQNLTDKIIKLKKNNEDEYFKDISSILNILRFMYDDIFELIPEDESFLSLIFNMKLPEKFYFANVNVFELFAQYLPHFINNKLRIEENFQEILNALRVKFSSDFQKFSQYKNVVTRILDAKPPILFFYSKLEYFEILAEFNPSSIIKRLESEKHLDSIKNYLVTIVNSYEIIDYMDKRKGLNQIIDYILKNKFDILDFMNPYLYHYLSRLNKFLIKRLLDEAKKKCHEKGKINQDCFDKYINTFVEWICEKYNFEPDFEELYYYGGTTINKHENRIVLESLHNDISLLLISKFSNFFTYFIIDFLNNPSGFEKNENIIATLLSSENPDFLSIIPPKMFRWVIPFDDITRRLFFEKIEVKYNSNKGQHEEYLIKKCTEFLNLLIINPQEVEELKEVDPDYEDQLCYYTYDHIEEVYYIDSYNEILTPLFKIHPPTKLFTQNRLFLKFYRPS